MPVAERHKIGREFARLGKQYGLTVKACAEGQDLAPLGVDCSGCMTAQTYQTALQCQLQIPKQNPPDTNAPACWATISALMIPAPISAVIAMPTPMQPQCNETCAAMIPIHHF